MVYGKYQNSNKAQFFIWFSTDNAVRQNQPG